MRIAIASKMTMKDQDSGDEPGRAQTRATA